MTESSSSGKRFKVLAAILGAVSAVSVISVIVLSILLYAAHNRSRQASAVVRVPERRVSVAQSPTQSASADDAKTASDLNNALEDYQIWSLQHRKATFQAHLVKDNILFAVVLVVVGFGLYLSFIQFKKGDSPEGSLKLGAAGVEVTSSVLGVVILTFSIGFLYLYLVHVFPIQEVGGQEVLPSESSSSNLEGAASENDGQ